MEAPRIEFYRRRLIQLRRAVEQNFQINRRSPDFGSRQIPPGGPMPPAERDPRINLTELHLAIDRALARISRGRFGQCSVCHGPIQENRLARIPYTNRCGECAFEEITTIESPAVFENRKT